MQAGSVLRAATQQTIAVWSAPPGGSLSFTLAQGQTSGVYSLKPQAPTGLQSYGIMTPEADPPPKVLIEP